MQILNRNICVEDLMYAIKGSPEHIIRRFIDNMSRGSALEILGRVCYIRGRMLENVIEAQEKILAKIKELEERGEIVIKR